MSRTAVWIVPILLNLARYYVESKNVVFLPFMVYSHQRAHGFVAEELAKMNHTVWLALSAVVENRNTENFSGVNTFSYNEFWDSSEAILISNLEGAIHKAVTTGTDPDWTWLNDYENLASEAYMTDMRLKKLETFLEKLQPDLIVIDWYPATDERVAIAYKLKVPFAVLSPLFYPITGGVPFNPVAEAYNSAHFRNNLSLYEQVKTIIEIMSPLFKITYNDRGSTKILFPNDPNVPPSTELIPKAEVFITESDPLSDYPRPTLPNVKFVGGLSISTVKELMDPFKSFIEKSEKAGVGVAVLSLGSMFMNLPKEIETKLVTVVKRLSFNTIWRANFTSPDPNKILTSTWLPVNDLLGHKNVKVFISHMGLHSLYEALYHAVPTVCLPLFFDQFYITERAEERGFCLSVDLLKTSEDEFVRIIEEVVSCKKIKSSLNSASEIYRQLYKNPRQEAAFWLDHVMKYGGGYMRYSGQNMSRFIFILDYVIVYIAGVVFTLVCLFVCFAFKKAFNFCLRRKRHRKMD